MRPIGLLKMMAILAAAGWLAGCVTTQSGSLVRYRGGDVITSNIIVLHWPNKIFISVSSTTHHFYMQLPYSESWQLESDINRPLHARDKACIATVIISDLTANSPREYYENLLKYIRDLGKVEIKDVSFSNSPADQREILKFKARYLPDVPKPAAMDIFVRHYWSAVSYRGKWYALHISDWDETRAPHGFERDYIVMWALGTFNPGFDEKREK